MVSRALMRSTGCIRALHRRIWARPGRNRENRSPLRLAPTPTPSAGAESTRPNARQPEQLLHRVARLRLCVPVAPPRRHLLHHVARCGSCAFTRRVRAVAPTPGRVRGLTSSLAGLQVAGDALSSVRRPGRSDGTADKTLLEGWIHGAQQPARLKHSTGRRRAVASSAWLETTERLAAETRSGACSATAPATRRRTAPPSAADALQKPSIGTVP
ncbi:hypothetical protein C2845_PM09G13020 [Panicum miliaceum]|uniref:Uncharacterized protein n=1 Tax=Panicum miliaceum TaxID=4540 RepID=A0A3L6S1D1_PANMI|nr:hypothetical protein C2845_PM09G13020 [Panicum miliaceum]